jgi:hypothetical protein
MRKLRGLAADFQGQMAMIDRELELEDLRRQLREMRDPELEKQIEKVMSEERPVRPPAPITAAGWAGSAAEVEEHELLPADPDALRAIDAERAASVSAPAVATAEPEAEIDLEASLYLGADDFLAGEQVRPAAAADRAEAAEKAEVEAVTADSGDAPIRQKPGGAEDSA